MEYLLTTKELLKILQISRTTLHKLIENGEIPYRKIGGQNRFIKKEIEKYLKEKEKNNDKNKRK
jgi:excisionase family DNA binding protein